MRARIRRLDPRVALPAYQTAASAGFDFTSNEAIVIAPGEVRLVGTGLVVEAPPGYCLALFVRSSLPVVKGLILANGVGIVDADYAGPEDEIKVALLNVRAAPVAIARGDRIAQGIFLPVSHVEWEEVATLGRPSRGGFGSSGGYQ